MLSNVAWCWAAIFLSGMASPRIRIPADSISATAFHRQDRIRLRLLTETFQSIFVFVMAILIARFIPQLATETVDRTHVAMKGAAICITGLGTYLLLVAR